MLKNSRPLLRTPRLALLGISACGFLSGCMSNGSISPDSRYLENMEFPENTAPSSFHAAAPAPSTQADIHQIVIDNFTFAPEELTVPAGTTVTWVNHDDVPHTATSSAKPRAFN